MRYLGWRPIGSVLTVFPTLAYSFQLIVHFLNCRFRYQHDHSLPLRQVSDGLKGAWTAQPQPSVDPIERGHYQTTLKNKINWCLRTCKYCWIQELIGNHNQLGRVGNTDWWSYLSCDNFQPLTMHTTFIPRLCL